MPTATNPFPYFPEAGTGGYIYIGAANQDAEANPITVYRDEARTIPWAQPIRTVDGYPAFQGAPAAIYTASSAFSFTVKDANNNTRASSLNVSTIVDAAALASASGAALIGTSTGLTVEASLLKLVSTPYSYSANITFNSTFAGNGGRAAKFGIVETFTTTQGSVGNIGRSLVFNNNQGPVSLDRYGVGLFVAGNALAGATDTWGANFANYVNVGVSANSNNYALELDQNISNTDYGAGTFAYTGANGAFEATPLKIVNGGPCKATASILTVGTGQLFYRGAAWSGDCVASATIQDDTNAPTVMLVSGAHTYGIDLSRATGMNTAFFAPYAANITQIRADSTQVKMYMTSDHVQHLSDGAVGAKFHCSVLPSADNAFTLGGTGARWSVVWAATGTINTSDPRAKTDIKPLGSMLGLVNTIVPYSAKYKIGGQVAEEYETVELLQATEPVEIRSTKIEIVDGQAVEREVVTVHDEPIFDEVPVFDADGNPVMVEIPAKAAVEDADGNIVSEARPAQTFQKTYRKPRMVEKPVKAVRYVNKPGKRDHCVFMADENLQQAFSDLGLDFAGFVEGEDGLRGLRYDQFVPVLWKAVQELSAKVKALEAAK